MPPPSVPPIDVLMVSTSYPASLEDWRGLFIRHLVDAMARRQDIRLRLWAPPGEVAAGVESDPTIAEAHWLARLMHQGGIAHLLRTTPVRGALSAARLLRLLSRVYRRNAGSQVLHLNWLQCALPLPRDGRPLLVSVLGTDLKLLSMPLMRQLLRRRIRGRPAVICPNADWMVPQLEEAFGDLARVRFLAFGIDPVWFAVARRPQLPSRWLAVTRLTRDKLGPLLAWGEPLFAGQARELHLFGPMQETIELPDWVHYHGPAAPAALAENWFPSAAGLVSLSRHAEGRPQVMLEAMAAGLPVLASDIPAHRSFLEHERTGWLCDSPRGLGEALQWLEEPGVNAAIGEAAREWARRTVGTWDDCAARYADEYRRLLGARQP